MRLIHGDCLEVMREIPDSSVDMVLCDLPYGTTANKWDSVIPFAPLWGAYRRICKPNAAIVLTASQPFTTDLINSARDIFRYELIWDKTKGGNFMLAKKQPMKSHENVCVFYRAQPTYNPKMEIRGRVRKKGGGRASSNFGVITPSNSCNNSYYPKSVITVSSGSSADRGLHPTQKPVGLFRYLIRTYSNPGDTVLDNCMGSGTAGIACGLEGRNFIGIEKDFGYYCGALGRCCDYLSS
jgi:site-specific DNA-methyltransferase (adenine-specific)